MTIVRIHELNFDNVDQWPQPVKYFIAALLACLIIMVGYWAIIKPHFEQYPLRVTQLNELKAKFEQKQGLASTLQAYRLQLQTMNKRFGNLLKQLPVKNEMPGLLEDISKTGISTGLTFELVAPQPEIIHKFYIELPITITVLGNYHQFALFLSRIADMSRIVTLHDIEIGLAEDSGQLSQQHGTRVGAKETLLMMNMTAKIYRYRIL